MPSLHKALKTAPLKTKRFKLNLTSAVVLCKLHPGALLAVMTREEQQAKKALMTSALHPFPTTAMILTLGRGHSSSALPQAPDLGLWSRSTVLGEGDSVI